jgi:hypothetical protein
MTNSQQLNGVLVKFECLLQKQPCNIKLIDCAHQLYAVKFEILLQYAESEKKIFKKNLL